MKTIEELAEIAYNEALIERYRRGDGHSPKWEDCKNKECWLSATLAMALTVDENYLCKLAHAGGKRIEFRLRDTSEEWEHVPRPEWYRECEYRIALPNPPKLQIELPPLKLETGRLSFASN